MFRVFNFIFFKIWLVLFVLFTGTKSIYASNSLNLLSPPDNAAEDKTPKLSWEYRGECSNSGSCFRIEIDNDSNFSSPEKSAYTKSSFYSPQSLTEGIYFWHVKAKDNNEKWSDWSPVFKFTIGSFTSPPPVPSSSQTPTPSISIKQENKFEIKDLPDEINSDQEFEITVMVQLNERPNTKFFLKGAFHKQDSGNYFGETFAGDWVKNGITYSKQIEIQTNSDSIWEGKIKIRPDISDSGFDGTGNYLFKVGRYTESGAGPVWSNEKSLKINEVEIPEPAASEEPEEYIEEDFEELSKANPSSDYEIKIASVAAEATMSNNMALAESEKVIVKENKKTNWLLVFAGILIFIGGISYGFKKLHLRRLLDSRLRSD